MHRLVWLVFVALVVASLGFVTSHAYLDAAERDRQTLATAPSVAAAETNPSPSGTHPTADAPDAGVVIPPPKSEIEQVLAGGPVPPLPNNAPMAVDLAVILFTHEDAQFAPRNARSKAAAHALAKALVAEAAENFKEAVKKGDPGSTDDAGTVPRGVLEPSLQYLVYTLEKGSVFPDPVDTPRGYWIVKRIR